MRSFKKAAIGLGKFGLGVAGGYAVFKGLEGASRAVGLGPKATEIASWIGSDAALYQGGRAAHLWGKKPRARRQT